VDSARQKRFANSTEERIREVAIRLFAQKGFQGTGIRDIAVETGLTSSALYYYMGTKETLLLQIMREVTIPLVEKAQQIAASSIPPESQLASLVLLHVWVHGTQPLSTHIAHSELHSLTGDACQEMLDWRDRYDRLWREILKRGNDEDVFEVQNSRLAALALIEMCSGISRWYRPDGELTLHQLCHMHADWALGLVRATRDGSSVRSTDLDLADPATYSQN
jgi:AcrR family transcriptional regulator